MLLAGVGLHAEEARMRHPLLGMIDARTRSAVLSIRIYLRTSDANHRAVPAADLPVHKVANGGLRVETAEFENVERSCS